MNVDVQEISQNVYDVKLYTLDPDTIALVQRIEALEGKTTPEIIEVPAGTAIYTLTWTDELKDKYGDVIKEPTVLVKAPTDPSDTWTVIRSSVKYIFDLDGTLSGMTIPLSNLQAKIIIL